MNYLPDELLLNIFSYLDYTSLLNVSKVCTSWKKKSYDPSLGLNLFHDLGKNLKQKISSHLWTRVHPNPKYPDLTKQILFYGKRSIDKNKKKSYFAYRNPHFPSICRDSMISSPDFSIYAFSITKNISTVIDFSSGCRFYKIPLSHLEVGFKNELPPLEKKAILEAVEKMNHLIKRKQLFRKEVILQSRLSFRLF